MRKIVLCCISAVFFLNAVYAQNVKQTKLIKSADMIANLSQSLHQLQQQVSIKVIFPRLIPYDKQINKYYIFAEKNASGYVINVDTTKECKGVHYCNIGSLTVEVGGFPQIFYDMQNREITIPIKIKPGIKAYYTPGHPMADFWPTTLQWRDQNILFTLRWNLSPNDEKSAIVEMAQSFS